jgi:hypothetical protein
MNSRKCALAAAAFAAAALLPSISAAADDKDSLNACARAFAASIAAPGALPPTFKLAYNDRPADSLLVPYRRGSTFYLQAHDPKSGVILARATCSTNFQGSVTELVDLKLRPSLAD